MQETIGRLEVKLKLIIIALTAVLATGCATVDHGKYAVLSPTKIDNLDNYEMIDKEGLGEDKGIYWALYVSPPPTVEKAVHNALEENGGVFIKNAEIYLKSWIIPLIWGEFKMVVKGEIWGEKPEANKNVSMNESQSNNGN